MLSIILFIIISIILAYIVITYTLIKNNRANSRKAWYELKTKFDEHFSILKPLIKFVKNNGYSEAEMVISLKKAYSIYKKAKSPNDYSAAYLHMDRGLNRLMFISKTNSILNEDQTYKDLIAEIILTSEKVSFQSKFYNDLVKSYNKKVIKIPTSIIANIFNFGIMTEVVVAENDDT